MLKTEKKTCGKIKFVSGFPLEIFRHLSKIFHHFALTYRETDYILT